MLLTVLSGFFVAALAPLVHRHIPPRHSGLLFALFPACLFFYFAQQLPAISAGAMLLESQPWVAGLDIRLSFMLDGLSLLFALLITGIGTFILIYTGRYLGDHPALGRLYALLLCFMASMLGLVLSDNLIGLFVFWELTSITSYLLIGFNHEDAKTRAAALQGFFITAGGGLALMTGLILLGLAGGSFELSQLLSEREALQAHPLFLPMLLLILVGAFTKSAQYPFHFWLPNAMAAPTPVSAYLHSATMVKAGVYLLARLQPALGGNDAWLWLLGLTGAITMLMGVYLASRTTGIKQMLAYSTVMALGTLTMLIGIGTEQALIAAMAFLLAHALYKGALFMIAGVIDFSTGAKDFLQTGGLARQLPITAAAAVGTALSLAGLAPMFGFIAKETMLESVMGAPALAVVFSVAAFLSATLGITIALVVGIWPWFIRRDMPELPTAFRSPGPALLAGPVVLALLGLGFGLLPALPEQALSAAASAAAGHAVVAELALWHGVNTALVMSIAALLLGTLLFCNWGRWRSMTDAGERFARRLGPERLYAMGMEALVRFSAWQTRVLQNGYLRYYLMTTLGTMVVLVMAALSMNLSGIRIAMDFSGVAFYEYVIAAVLAASSIAAVLTNERLGAVAALGALGFTVALTYVMFSAPDLAITQVLVETLTVILLVLVLFRLPGFLKLSSRPLRLLDALTAVIVGGTFTVLILAVTATRYFPSISQYFVEHAVSDGFGRNIVNVILVDFRGLDTLGEIAVLSLAAIGIFAMLKLRSGGQE
ncbi:putative monovalent cation/H+ antiporter subunit A [Alcanivorax quisquiliarum]|uniref:Monovalent cation/H+ antiporter subunit A n=1 Tax=Alcanivorax quisquiliarum TaxID=2933565 RepID=A0ABT0E8Y8_9GAMM|nr:putative monovalent cation/H+ antiporter subunit A [Alcanivorax quisquiliarum]MCK0538303.1 putative monovalent cation/H+ antiporter subunit A [Alcanivorax quisquiliarum]